MKGFPSSDQNSDDTSARKHDLCDFETSLIIQIRHDSGKERDMCTNNGNLHFFHFFPFFKTLERILNTSVDSHNSFKRKKVSNRKGKTNSPCIWHPTKGCFKNFKNKTKNSAAQARPQAAHVLASATTMGRGHMVCTLFIILSTTCVSVCVILSLCLSYHVLRLLVSPRLQQELHNCGATIARGQHERCLVISLYKDRGREGAHHSSEEKRTKGENKRRREK